MRLSVLLLAFFVAFPLAAQEKKAQPQFGYQKEEKKAEKRPEKKHRKKAEKKPEKKPEPRAGMVQKGPSNARFGSTVDQSEIDRAKKAAEKKP
jgi:hypothetical protein